MHVLSLSKDKVPLKLLENLNHASSQIHGGKEKSRDGYKAQKTRGILTYHRQNQGYDRRQNKEI